MLKSFINILADNRIVLFMKLYQLSVKLNISRMVDSKKKLISYAKVCFMLLKGE